MTTTIGFTFKVVQGHQYSVREQQVGQLSRVSPGLSGRDNFQIRFAAQADVLSKENMQRLAEQLSDNPTLERAQDIAKRVIACDVPVRQKQDAMRSVYYALRKDTVKNEAALEYMQQAWKQNGDALSTKVETAALGERLKVNPADPQSQKILAQLIEYIDNYDTNISPDAARALGAAAENPKAWAIIKTPLLALVGSQRQYADNTNRAHPIETAVSTAAGYKHTWPEILPELLKFPNEAHAMTTLGYTSSKAIGRMAAKNPDIWQVAKVALFEKVQPEQPSQVRQKALAAIAAAVQDNQALWADVKKQITSLLKDSDMAVVANAVAVVAAAAGHLDLVPELIPIINTYVEDYLAGPKQRMDALSAKAEAGDAEASLELFELDYQGRKSLFYTQFAYAKLAAHPAAWSQLRPTLKKAFVEEVDDENHYITWEGSGGAQPYIQTFIAAARYPQNWQGEYSVEKFMKVLPTVDYESQRIAANTIAEYIDNDFFWNKVKPMMTGWLEAAPGILNGPDGPMHWLFPLEAIKVVAARVKAHPEEWSEFETPFRTLWEGQIKHLEEYASGNVISERIVEEINQQLAGVFPGIQTSASKNGDLFRRGEIILAGYQRQREARRTNPRVS